MSPFIVFDAKDFMDALSEVKDFWLSSKMSRMRIVAHKESNTAEFYSINQKTGLETAISLPVKVPQDVVIYIKNVGRFYDSVVLLQEINVGQNGSIKLRLSECWDDPKKFSLSVLLDCQKITGSYKEIP